MFFKKTTMLASASLILASTIAMANVKQKIENLPEEGQVAITGQVNSIETKRDFTLKDESGKTISVQSPNIIKFNKGDNVEVHGHIGNDIMGENKGITAFKINIKKTEEEPKKERTSFKLDLQQ